MPLATPRRPRFAIAMALVAIAASGCAAPAQEDDGADDSAAAATEGSSSGSSGSSGAGAATTATVTLPICTPKPNDLPADPKIRYLIAPKYVFHIEASGLAHEGLESKGKITVNRKTRDAQPANVGTLDATSGELRFTLDRADVPVTAFTLDFASLARGPLTAATKKHLSEMYTVYIMKDGWLGDAIAVRCEGGGS